MVVCILYEYLIRSLHSVGHVGQREIDIEGDYTDLLHEMQSEVAYRT